MPRTGPAGVKPVLLHQLHSRIVLLAILLAALALRIWGIGDRLPDPSLGISPLDDSVVEESDRTEMYRAWAMWEGGAKKFTLDPGTVGWPSLSFYLTLAVQLGYRAAWSAVHGSADTAAFVQHFAEHPEGLFIAGRAAGALIGVWSVFMLYRLGRRVTDSSTACIAALFLAFNPLHIQLSQRVSDPNLLALLFVLMMAPPLIRVPSDPGLRSLLLSALFLGLATGAKYVPAVFLLVLITQIVVGHRSGAYRGRASLAVRLLVGPLVAAAAFVLSSPYVILRGSAAWVEVQSQGAALTSEWVGQTSSPFALLTYLVSVLPAAATWPLYLLSGFGLVLAYRRGGALRTLALLPVGFVLANGLLRVAQDRYILAAIPFLLLGSAIAVGSLAGFIGKMSRSGSTLATAVAVVGLLVLPLKSTAAYRNELARPDSRHAARRWIQANIPPSEPMAMELYGPVFNSGRLERLAVTWPFYSAHSDAVRAAYAPAFLHGLKYYVLSGEVRRRFEGDPGHSQREIAFYRWLDRFGIDIWTSRGSGLGGPEIHVLRLPENISTTAERDSAWRSSSQIDPDSVRLARWCGDLATAHSALARTDLVAEWAQRGATLAKFRPRLNLLGMAAEALLSQGKAEAAAQSLDRAVREYPGEFDLLVLHGIVLEQIGRPLEAASQFRGALIAAPTHPGRSELIDAITRLEGKIDSPR
ncbi:MAG: glycosyltransferase family 39 protein [Candidatus Eisenbacteria bacterium]